MMELARFAGSVLRLVQRRKIGLDKAFQQARMPKKVRQMPAKLVYKVARGVVSDYYLLRHVANEVYGRSVGPYELAGLWLYYKGEEALEEYESSVRKLRRDVRKGMARYRDLEDILDELHDPGRRLSVEFSFPRWFVDHLRSLVGDDEARKVLEGLNEEILWIRVNSLKADPDSVVRELEELGLRLRRDGELEYMYRILDYENPPATLRPVERGMAILQDKSSALVVEALEPEPGDVLLDLTAAPGLKTSLFYMLTGGRARVVAMDLSLQRLRSARSLLRLYGVKDVELLRGDAVSPPMRAIKGAKVLLDVPCTSSGATGRDPAIKVHLEDARWISRFPRLQRRMLLSSMQRLKGYERLVYATCSVLDTEGEGVVSGLSGLKRPKLSASYGYSKYPFAEKVARLFPHIHHSEGFFIAMFQR